MMMTTTARTEGCPQPASQMNHRQLDPRGIRVLILSRSSSSSGAAAPGRGRDYTTEQGWPRSEFALGTKSRGARSTVYTGGGVRENGGGTREDAYGKI